MGHSLGVSVCVATIFHPSVPLSQDACYAETHGAMKDSRRFRAVYTRKLLDHYLRMRFHVRCNHSSRSYQTLVQHSTMPGLMIHVHMYLLAIVGYVVANGLLRDMTRRAETTNYFYFRELPNVGIPRKFLVG